MSSEVLLLSPPLNLDTGVCCCLGGNPKLIEKLAYRIGLATGSVTTSATSLTISINRLLASKLSSSCLVIAESSGLTDW